MSEYNFTDNQIAIIEKLALKQSLTDLDKLLNANDYKSKQLETLLKVANALYRSGHPIIDDQKYDEYLDLFNETQMLAVRKSIRRKDGKPKIGQKENSRNDE